MNDELKHPHPSPSPSKSTVSNETSVGEGLKAQDNAPYPGLRPYREDEKAKFFGRDVDAEILIDKVLTNRLTLLFAASGVGKSSLLQAAVIPHLKSKTGENLTVVYHTDWVSDPVRSVRDAVLQALRAEGLLPEHSEEAEFGEKLPDLLAFCEVFVRPPLVLILDQFEEFFRYQRHQTGFKELIDQLTTIITDKSLPVHLILSMREDFALELNAFKPKLPTILFENFYRLEKLGRQAVRDAIVIPAEQRGFTYEPELLKQLLADLLSREMDRQPNSPVVELLETVEPPYMQIVCARLWELNAGDSEKVLRLASYEKAGRAQGILKNYLEGVLQRFSFAEKQLASAAFDHLVSLRGVKMAYTAKGLAETVRVDEGELAKVLKRLESVRILREIPRKDELWYELYHDMFSGSIEDWNNVWKDRMRRRRSAKVVGGVIFGIGVLFAGWDYYINTHSYYFRLSPKQGISDQVELWQGKPGSIDFFEQKQYLAEMDANRYQLEPDKQFNLKSVNDYSAVQTELIGERPSDQRVTAYTASGHPQRAINLAASSIVPHNLGLAKRVLPHLAAMKVPEATRLLYRLLQESASSTIREEIGGNSLDTDADTSQGMGSSAIGITLSQKGFTPNEDISIEERYFWYRIFSSQSTTQMATENLIRLSNDNSELKINLIDRLLIIPDKSLATTQLRKLLTNENTEIQVSAINTLSTLKVNEAEQELLLALQDPEAEVREAAINVLGELNSNAAIPALITALHDTKSFVQRAAARTLGELKAKAAIPDLLKIIQNKDEEVSVVAIGALESLESREAIPKLLPMLDGQTREVRIAVVNALGKLRVTEAVPQLLVALNSKDSSLTSSAVSALWKIAPESVIPVLLATFKQSDISIRSAIVEEFKTLKAESAIPELLVALQDKDQDTARIAAELLGAIKAKGASPFLINALKRHETGLRIAVIEALGELNSQAAATDLLTFLEDKHEPTRVVTAEALGKLKYHPAAPSLLISLVDISKEVRETAAEALDSMEKGIASELQNLDTKSTIQTLQAALKDHNWSVRNTAAKLLGELSTPLTVPVLLGALKDDDPDVRNSILAALEKAGAGTEAVLPTMLKAIKSEDGNTRSAAAQTLGVTKNRAVIPELLSILKDEFEDVRAAGAGALGQLNARSAVPRLSLALRDSAWHVRQNAAIALGKIQAREAIPALLLALQDNDSDVRFAASRALVTSEAQHLLPSLFFIYEEGLSNSGSLVENLDFSDQIVSGELLGLLLRQNNSQDITTVALSMLRSSKLTKTQKRLLQKVLAQIDKDTLTTAKENLIIQDKQETVDKSTVISNTENQPGLEKKALTLPELKQKLIDMDETYSEWRTQRDTEVPANDSPEGQGTEKPAENNLTNPAPFIYEYAYAIAHESESEGIKLLSHNLYKVREAAARGLANGDALGVGLLKKLEKAWLETKDPIERQGIYHAIDIALLAIEGVGYKKELADLKAYEPTLTNKRSAASIKPRVEWTRIQLQWRVDANKELEELAARQLPKLLKEYCLNEDGTDMKPEECTLEN